MIISQSVLSGNVEKNQKVLSGDLSANQKVLSGTLGERITTIAKWGKITGDIYSQQDLITLLDQCQNVVTGFVEEPNGEDITVTYLDTNGVENTVTLTKSYVLDRLRYVYRNGQMQDVLAIFETSDIYSLPVPTGVINVTVPEYVVWVNDGSFDGRMIKMATAEGTANGITALKDYIVNNYATNDSLADVATSGDISDLVQQGYFILDCGSSTRVVGG